jgi:endonuclease/exonuclease/phosphatase family metal-dependent hydrolase
MPTIKCFLLSLILCSFSHLALSQNKDYKVACVGFYNLENLFDIENDTLINDEEFLPEGEKAWSAEKYEEKVGNMAYVISKLGTELTPQGISLLGVSEVENRKVLHDLVNHPLLQKRDYRIVHSDSPDWRGIDVALIYQAGHFKIEESSWHPLVLYRDNGSRKYTRDVLMVRGKLDGESINVLVNHWPSRSGGAERSAPGRNAGAKLCRNLIDSLETLYPDSKTILMGDLNDDPTSPSVKSYLKAKRTPQEVKKGGLYNPMEKLYEKGIGSNAWRDSWSLFDQVIVSEALLDKKQKGYFFYQAHIYNKKFLTQKSGRYKGYPFRTFSGDSYTGGYSDHYPVFVYLLKEI